MEVFVAKDIEEGSRKAFEVLEEAIKEENAQVLGLATGSTPEGLYREMVASDRDYSDMISVNLDEYVGLAPEHSQSYHYYMNEHLFSKKPFKKSYVPDGTKDELEATEKYNRILKTHPVDVQILGIGHNGHIAFNEPGTSFDTKTHKIELTEDTIQANKRFFENEEEVPRSAYTMGIASIMSAKKIILLAYGTGKAEIIQQTLEGPVTTEVPASVLQNHPNVTVILDKDSAELLKETRYETLV